METLIIESISGNFPLITLDIRTFTMEPIFKRKKTSPENVKYFE